MEMALKNQRTDTAINKNKQHSTGTAGQRGGKRPAVDQAQGEAAGRPCQPGPRQGKVFSVQGGSSRLPEETAENAVSTQIPGPQSRWAFSSTADFLGRLVIRVHPRACRTTRDWMRKLGQLRAFHVASALGFAVPVCFEGGPALDDRHSPWPGWGSATPRV